MGALTINRKRVDESFSLYNQSPLVSSNLTDNSYYSHQIDTNSSKKPRISRFAIVPVEKVKKLESSVSRIQKYPEIVGKLRREVHAPCRSNRVGFLSSSSSGGLKARVSDRREKGESNMGNVLGGWLRRDYEDKRNAAIGTLRHIKVKESREVVEVGSDDSNELVVIKDGNEEVRSEGSDKRRGFESNGLGVAIESRDLDGKGLEDDMMIDGNVVHKTYLGREAYKDLFKRVESSFSPKLKNLNFQIKSTEAKLDSVRSLKKQPKELKKPQEDLLQELFVPLTKEEKGEIKRALSNSNRNKVLVTHENSNIQITGETLLCLRPGAWLNDEVINVYLELLKERERREPKKYLTCHFFNTFFYKKLAGGRNGYDYKAVRRWTTLRKLGYKLTECDKIFVPIHKEVHWCLAVINKKDKTFQYLDSLGGRDSQVLRVLAQYYADEVKDKCGEDVDVSSWDLEFVEDLPEQQNGYDCGVFMIKYADFYSRGMGLHFSQENMPYFRDRTAKEILKLHAH